MILDSSAILAILLREKGWEDLVDKLSGAREAGVGAPTLAEAGIVLSARLGREGVTLLSLLVHEAGLTVIPFGEAHWRTAVDAFRRFGKGQHRAGLNFGDCMSYAVAKLSGEPLLCTGRDFARTDLPLS